MTSLTQSSAVRRQVLGAAACVVAAAALGAAASLPNLHWYATLRRPGFQPPVWAFGLVWMAFQGATVWALTRVLRSPDWMPDRAAAIRAFFIQLGWVALWPVAVFGLYHPRLGLIVAVAWMVAAVLTMRLFGLVDRTAGRVLMPYVGWIVIVLLLNRTLTLRN